MTRIPLGTWMGLPVDEKRAWHARGGFYIDVTDLTGANIADADTKDRAEHLDEMSMTDADYRAWTQPQQTQGRKL